MVAKRAAACDPGNEMGSTKKKSRNTSSTVDDNVDAEVTIKLMEHRVNEFADGATDNDKPSCAVKTDGAKNVVVQIGSQKVLVEGDKNVNVVQVGATDVATVQSIITSPINVCVEESEVSAYSDVLKGRISTMSYYTNRGANIYSIARMLPTATWGPYHHFNDKSKVLINPVTGQPITVWIVGHVTRLWFMKSGMPDRQASINVALLSRSLSSQTSWLLAMLSMPPQSSVEDGWANPVLFNVVYDVRKAFRSKTHMKHYHVTDLKARDLVLLEAKVTRY
ncbi:hypothetical protein BV22DRAFT_1051777 [Leucogyrophana mollusca]|uniref:Uncharacterized protein n=1 Tax=Leucogyrophana mollusca TaxID=85980 RepID=A0ACB8AY98_9AGAM|nr:hypothetical protein BV22DRAFT_1051777 [Leucogyrophana mollusca]